MSKKILIIDDDNDCAILANQLLTAKGYAVEVKGTAASALSYCKQTASDLILLDLILPDRPGLVLLAEIRTIETLKQTPIIVFSAHSLEAIKEKVMKAGGTDFIEKEALMKDLSEIVKKHLP